MTEGEKTEPQYVEGLNRRVRAAGATVVVRPVGVGKDPEKVLDKCIEIRDSAAGSDKAYDHCVCLVDVDEHARLHDVCTRAAAESVLLLVSRLKFEVWLCWHVDRSRAALGTKQLDVRVKELRLLDGKLLSRSFPFDAVDEASRTARLADPDLAPGRVGPDPSSAMPVLVDLMRRSQTA